MHTIDYNNLDELRIGFINYLKTYHPNIGRPEVRAGNALFIGRHNIGISLEETLTTPNGIHRAKKNARRFLDSRRNKKKSKEKCISLCP